jgi:hypothetical protein
VYVMERVHLLEVAVHREKASRGGLWSLACLEDHKLKLRCGWGHLVVLNHLRTLSEGGRVLSARGQPPDLSTVGEKVGSRGARSVVSGVHILTFSGLKIVTAFWAQNLRHILVFLVFLLLTTWKAWPKNGLVFGPGGGQT